MPRVHHVKKARKDNPAVKAGESYYWWKFRFGGKRFSKTYPRRALLTQSSFLSQLYDLQDLFEFDKGDLETSVEKLISQIEELQSECEDSLSNMPEHLQETSDAGMLLQERIDALEDWVAELQSVDLENEDAIGQLQECDCGL